MGHITSDKLGGPERLMLQDAWENQLNNLTIESGRIGGAVLDQPAVSIGNIAVSQKTALMWEKFGMIPSGMATNAPLIDLSLSKFAPTAGVLAAGVSTPVNDALRSRQSAALIP
jgi:hypothetical protein